MNVLENIELRDCVAVAILQNTSNKIKLREPSRRAILDTYYTSTVTSASVQPVVNDNQTSETAVSQNNNGTCVKTAEGVAIDARLAAIITILHIQGKMNGQGYKALKIKPLMYENMLKNSASQDAIAETPQLTPALNAETVEPETTQETPLTMESQIAEVKEEQVKVSKNGSSVAKIEKFIEAVIDTSNAKTIMIPADDTETVSPVTIEQENARPVSREMPLIAPEREKKGKLNLESEAHLATDNITSVSVDMEKIQAIKEYLKQLAQVKMEAEEAKRKETAAQEAAAKAKQEALYIRDEFTRAQELVEEHQQGLIAQTAQSNANVTRFEQEKAEADAQCAGYQQAIDDMMAFIGVGSIPKREGVM